MDGVPSSDYTKPFHLYYYNKPKLPPLPKIKPVDYKAKPAIPVRTNYATKMRNKIIKETTHEQPDESFKSRPTGKMVIGDPEVVPRQTKTSQFRYKWVREVPVVSCRFTEHVMMFKKPPFVNQNVNNSECTCGTFKLRKMHLDSPKAPKPDEEEKKDVVFLQDILQ